MIVGLGVAWRLVGIFLRPARRVLSEPRSTATAAGAARAIATCMWHAKNFPRRSLARFLNAYAYHIGLAIIVFGFAPHIAFMERKMAADGFAGCGRKT